MIVLLVKINALIRIDIVNLGIPVSSETYKLRNPLLIIVLLISVGGPEMEPV